MIILWFWSHECIISSIFFWIWYENYGLIPEFFLVNVQMDNKIKWNIFDLGFKWIKVLKSCKIWFSRIGFYYILSSKPNQTMWNQIYVNKIMLPHELMYLKNVSNSANSRSQSEVTLTKLLRVTRLQLLFLSASHDLKQE